GGFFHHVAGLAGEGDGAFAGHAGGFDEEDVSADGRISHSGGDAGDAGALRELGLEAAGAEEFFDLFGGDDFGFLFAADDLSGDAAGDRADAALEVAHTGLAGVAFDDVAEGVVLELGLALLQAVGFELAGDEILLGDGELVGLGVAGDLDD